MKERTKKITYITIGIMAVITAIVLTIGIFINWKASNYPTKQDTLNIESNVKSTIANPYNPQDENFNVEQFENLYSIGYIVPIANIEIKQVKTYTNIYKYTIYGIIEQAGEIGNYTYSYNNEKIILMVWNYTTELTAVTTGQYRFWRIIERNSLNDFDLTITKTLNAAGWYTEGYQQIPMWQPTKPYLDDIDIRIYAPKEFNLNNTNTYNCTIYGKNNTNTTENVIKWQRQITYENEENANNYISFELNNTNGTPGQITFFNIKGQSENTVLPTTTNQTYNTQTKISVNPSLYIGFGIYSKEQVEYYQNESFESGYDLGKTAGYNQATRENRSIWSLLINVGQVPLDIIQDILNFEILGVNLSNLVMAILTAILITIIIKIFV